MVKWSEVAQSCLTLWGPVDCSLPGSSVHGILQARILEWVTISFYRESSRPRDQTRVSRIVGRHFTVWATRESPYSCSVSLNFFLGGLLRRMYVSKIPNLYFQFSPVTQSCPTLCDSMDCSPPGFSIHGIFQAWVLEWVAINSEVNVKTNSDFQ